MTHWTRDLRSPIGTIHLAADDAALVRIVLPDEKGPRPDGRAGPGHPVLERAAEELEEWFAGTRVTFGVPLRATGTAFQHVVWTALGTIPYGATWSYGELAHRIGRPRAVRAVGAANGRNPLPIVVPCHRVIGASGALTGFGGGLSAKAWLLDHERGWSTDQGIGPSPLRQARAWDARGSETAPSEEGACCWHVTDEERGPRTRPPSGRREIS